MQSTLVYFTLAFFLNAVAKYSYGFSSNYNLPSGSLPVFSLIGDPCETTADCTTDLGDLSTCIDRKCSCIPNYAVPSQSNDKCLPIINFIGADCEETQQCTSGTPGNFSECSPSTLVPDINICNCTKDGINQPGRHSCLKRPNLIGDSCEMDFQCKLVFGELSLCTADNICGCEETAVANMEGSKPNTTCLPGGILIGEDGCTDMAQCVGIPGENSVCSGNYLTKGQCYCKGPHLIKDDKTDCLPIRFKVGDSCEVAEQCKMGTLGEKGTCDRYSKCACNGASGPDGTTCFPFVQRLNGTCMVNHQCTNYMGSLSQCVNFKCECKMEAYGGNSGQGYDQCYRRS